MTNPQIDGKLLSDWEKEWDRKKGGFAIPHDELRQELGLYRAVLDGEVVAIGRATEVGRGLSKRLGDLRRSKGSAGAHHIGRMIRKHVDELELEVLIVGRNHHAAEVTKVLRREMNRFHQPKWNVHKLKPKK